MTQLYSFPDSKHPLLSTLICDNLLSFIVFMYSNPLHLAYLLYFSPYLLQLLSFLFPLLLSTSILLLLLSLHFRLEGDIPTVCLLDQLSSLVVASIGNVFEWEYESMLELYNNLGRLNFGVEVYVESSARSELLESDVEGGERVNLEGSSFEPKDSISVYESLDNGRQKSELLESGVGIGDRVSLKGSRFEPQNPIVMPGNLIKHGRSSMGELYEILTPNRTNVREYPDEFSLKNLKQIEVLESQTRTEDQVSLKRDSFVPQTPDRNSEILISSPLNRKAGHGGGQCLPRSRSMKTTGELYKHSSLNCKVLQDPNQEFLNKQILKSESTRGSFKSSSVRRGEQECRAVGGLQRDGSMRKEKEWKRSTLGCKLYEERMSFKLREETSVDEGAEEMDLLWEAYEADAINMANKLKIKGKNRKREVHIEEVDHEIEEGDETVGKICCLQALRLSTGKMNVGVGRVRPNLMRISKAIKGFGFFRRSGCSRSRNG